MSDDWASILECLKTVSGKSGSFWASDTVDTHLSCPFLFLMKFARSHKNRHLIHLSDSLINYWTRSHTLKGSGYCLWTYAYHFLLILIKIRSIQSTAKKNKVFVRVTCMYGEDACLFYSTRPYIWSTLRSTFVLCQKRLCTCIAKNLLATALYIHSTRTIGTRKGKRKVRQKYVVWAEVSLVWIRWSKWMVWWDISKMLLSGDFLFQKVHF